MIMYVNIVGEGGPTNVRDINYVLCSLWKYFDYGLSLKEICLHCTISNFVQESHILTELHFPLQVPSNLPTLSLSKFEYFILADWFTITLEVKLHHYLQCCWL